MTEELDLKTMDRETAIKTAIEILGFTQTQAAFYVSYVRGEISGDVVTVDAQGNEVKEQ
jgi:hypothetical protein